jgi:hypothetical protein
MVLPSALTVCTRCCSGAPFGPPYKVQPDGETARRLFDLPT